jgi:hypothetical protein
MNLKLQYKTELESVTLRSPDGSRLINLACELSRLTAGAQAVRTMAKFMDPNNPAMITSFTHAMQLARNAVENVKNSPILQGGLVQDAAEQVERALIASHEVICGSGGALGTLTGLTIVKGDLPSRIAFLREVICEWLITMLADSQEWDSKETGGPTK